MDNNNYLIGLRGAEGQKTVMPLENFLRKVRITRHATTESERELVRTFSNNYKQKKISLLRDLRKAGFKPSQLNTLLSYLPEKIAPGKKTMIEAAMELEALKYIKSYHEAATNPDVNDNPIIPITQNPSKVREFINTTKRIAATGLITLLGLGVAAGCKRGASVTPPPPDNIYRIMVHARSMVEGFPDMKGAKVIVGDQKVAPGTSVTYNATDYGNLLKLYMTGGHDNVLCARAIDGSNNLAQSQNGQPVFINLSTLEADARVGSDVELVLYKIPSTMPIAAVEEAVREGTAVYDHAVIFGITGIGCSIYPQK